MAQWGGSDGVWQRFQIKDAMCLHSLFDFQTDKKLQIQDDPSNPIPTLFLFNCKIVLSGYLNIILQFFAKIKKPVSFLGHIFCRAARAN